MLLLEKGKDGKIVLITPPPGVIPAPLSGVRIKRPGDAMGTHIGGGVGHDAALNQGESNPVPFDVETVARPVGNRDTAGRA